MENTKRKRSDRCAGSGEEHVIRYYYLNAIVPKPMSRLTSMKRSIWQSEWWLIFTPLTFFFVFLFVTTSYTQRNSVHEEPSKEKRPKM